MKKETIDKDGMIAHLGESFHTAFRKAVDSEEVNEIHKLIREMPDESWWSILEFVYVCIEPFVNVEEDN